MNSHFVYCTTIDNVFGDMVVRYIINARYTIAKECL